MTPNFALSLSHEGIRLLHRVPEGWQPVGEVALDHADLNGAMAKLRDTAQALEPGDIPCKLVIPPEQIRYDALDSTRTTLDDIRTALDGATPYAIDELVIDFDRTGGRTHIAAVARETLEEAEGFALQHGFKPVSYVAVPAPYTFAKEVFFGATAAARQILPPGEDVQRDDSPMVEVAPAPEPAASAPAGADMPAPEDAPPAIFVRRGSGDVAAAPADPAATKPQDETVIAADMTGPDLADPVPKADTAEDAEAPVFKPRRAAPPLAVPTGVEDGPQIGTADAVAATGDAPMPEVIAARSAPVSAPPVSRTAQAARIDTGPATPTPAFAGPVPAARGKPRFLALKLTVGLLIILFVVAMLANAATQDGLAGWLQRGSDRQTSELAAVAPVETTAEPEGPAAPAGLTPAPLPEPAPAPAPSAIAPEATGVTQTQEAPPLPIVRAPAGRVLSPAEADRIYAATGVWQRAPRLPLTPRDSALGEVQRTTAVVGTTDFVALDMPDPDLMAADAPLAAQPAPPPAGTRYPRDLRGFIRATPEGTVTPYGTIVFAGAPQVVPPLRPGTDVPAAPADAVAATPDVSVNPDDVLVVTGRPPVVPPARPGDLAPPATENAALDANGTSPEAKDGADAIAARSEPDAETAAITGPPPVVPPLRPEIFATLVPEDATASVPQPPLADPTLAGFRPTQRPDGLAPPEDPVAEDPAEPDILAVAAAIAEAAPPAAFINVTGRAPRLSPRPDTRPRNFARVVARAEEISRRQTARDAAAATAARVVAPANPTGPVPGSVAQAATMTNAIQLRNINLIGVYGRPNARRALIRLGNGRYQMVEVGSRLDGGQVTAIGDSALNYVKRGRTYALQVPQG